MKTDLQKCIGKLFIHTKKAIGKGCPNFRLYCVAKVEEDPDGDPTQFLCAWKVDREMVAHFFHPAFSTKECHLLSIEKLRECELCIGESTNRSTPTATFIPDSYYKEVSLQQAINELEVAPSRK